MKNLKKIVYLIIIIVLLSCSDKKRYTSMSEMLSDCKGTTIVIAIEYNKGNIEAYQNGIIVIDTTGSVREWYGGKTNIKVGDTLK